MVSFKLLLKATFLSTTSTSSKQGAHGVKPTNGSRMLARLKSTLGEDVVPVSSKSTGNSAHNGLSA